MEYLLDMLLTPLPLTMESKAAKMLINLTRNVEYSPYIQYQFLMKYIILKLQHKRPISCVPLSKLEVFSMFFKVVFDLESKKKKPNSFLMYSFLRFASFIESPERISLIRRFGQFPIIHKHDFWKNILFFMSRYVYYFMNPKDQMEATVSAKEKLARDPRRADKGLIQKIEDFFDDKIVTVPKKQNIPPSRLKSYQDISELLMNMGLDLRKVTDILLELGKNCNIPLKQTTAILNKNQRSFAQHFSTISEEQIHIEDVMKDFTMRKFYQFAAMKFGRGKIENPFLGYLSFREKKTFLSERKSYGLFMLMKLTLPFLVGGEEGKN